MKALSRLLTDFYAHRARTDLHNSSFQVQQTPSGNYPGTVYVFAFVARSVDHIIVLRNGLVLDREDGQEGYGVSIDATETTVTLTRGTATGEKIRGFGWSA
jgi:hypothetical protein